MLNEVELPHRLHKKIIETKFGRRGLLTRSFTKFLALDEDAAFCATSFRGSGSPSPDLAPPAGQIGSLRHQPKRLEIRQGLNSERGDKSDIERKRENLHISSMVKWQIRKKKSGTENLHTLHHHKNGRRQQCSILFWEWKKMYKAMTSSHPQRSPSSSMASSPRGVLGVSR